MFSFRREIGRTRTQREEQGVRKSQSLGTKENKFPSAKKVRDGGTLKRQSYRALGRPEKISWFSNRENYFEGGFIDTGIPGWQGHRDIGRDWWNIHWPWGHQTEPTDWRVTIGRTTGDLDLTDLTRVFLRVSFDGIRREWNTCWSMLFQSQIFSRPRLSKEKHATRQMCRVANCVTNRLLYQRGIKAHIGVIFCDTLKKSAKFNYFIVKSMDST